MQQHFNKFSSTIQKWQICQIIASRLEPKICQNFDRLQFFECHPIINVSVGSFDENVQSKDYSCFFASFGFWLLPHKLKHKHKQAHKQSRRGQTCVIFKAVIISWHPMTTIITTMTMTTPTLMIMPIKRNQQLNTENGLWTQNISEDDISSLLTWMAGGIASLKVVMKKYLTSRPRIDYQQPQNFWNSDKLWVGLRIIENFVFAFLIENRNRALDL